MSRVQDCAPSAGVGVRIRKPSDESLMQRTDAGWMLRVVLRDSQGGPMDERRCSDTPAVDAGAVNTLRPNGRNVSGMCRHYPPRVLKLEDCDVRPTISTFGGCALVFADVLLRAVSITAMHCGRGAARMVETDDSPDCD